VPPTPTPTLFPYTTLFRSNGLLVSELLKSVGRLRIELNRAPIVIAPFVKNAHIGEEPCLGMFIRMFGEPSRRVGRRLDAFAITRSEEHTSELQSRGHLVCR